MPCYVIGAFKTSPTASILVEANLTPIKYIYRIILALKYGKTNRNKLWDNNDLSQHLQHSFQQNKKPLTYSIEKYKSQLNVQPYQPLYREIPQFIHTEFIHIDRHVKTYSSIFKYQNRVKIYTNGASNGIKKGCSMVFNEEEDLFGLPSVFTIFKKSLRYLLSIKNIWINELSFMKFKIKLRICMPEN